MAFNAKASRAKRPCPLWVDAFQRDTQHLEADEIGAYMLLLMAMWTRESCDFPNDDTRLARVCRVSLRLWKSRVGPVLRDFLKAEGDVLVSKRLRQEAEYVETEVQKQSDRKRGAYAKPQGSNERSDENGEKSDKQLKNNKPHQSADNPTDDPRYYPSQQPNNPTLDGDADTRASEREPPGALTFRERIIEAMGGNPVTGITGPSCRVVGTQADMAEASRWLDLPGMTEEVIVAEVKRISAGRSPPSTFRYFTRAMQELSGALSAPAVVPVRPQNGGSPQQTGRPAYDQRDQRRIEAEERERRIVDAAVHGTAKGFG
ncbi:MAG: DUF1376 domain-containing protein [Proteobacteria bacterium]|nr:DUF1376 domain-containing protein [Pseudomonadota bacterium]